MHSRIFQVSKEPINKNEYITQSEYYDHWFTREIADYVDDSDRAGDIEWLNSIWKGYKVSEDVNGNYLIVTDKKEYFKERYIRFQQYINKFKECTLDEFANGIDIWWDLKNTYVDKFDFYIQTDNHGLLPFDTFIRCCDENVKHYIGGTLDYHF